MSGAPTFDTGKKKKQKRGEFITPPRPTGRRSNKLSWFVSELPEKNISNLVVQCRLYSTINCRGRSNVDVQCMCEPSES